jgi:hypothetical protein
MTLVGLQLSSYTLGPIWINMQGILRTAVARVEAAIPPQQGSQEKIYGPGDAINVYRDLSEIVAAAKTSVFIADPYGDQEIFDLYLTKVAPGVRVRLLTKPPSPALRSLAGKYTAHPGEQFEARSTSAIHDRVIFIDDRDCWVMGQSMKDAAMKKPTYLLPVAAVSDMSRLYEDAWKGAAPY